MPTNPSWADVKEWDCVHLWLLTQFTKWDRDELERRFIRLSGLATHESMEQIYHDELVEDGFNEGGNGCLT